MSTERATTGPAEEDDIVATEGVSIPCFRCGICCTCYQAPLIPEDIESIACALGISESEFISGYAVRVPTKEGYLLRSAGEGCVFLARDEEGKAGCAIHPWRPKACRDWEPGLSRPACLEGLARLKSEGRLGQLDVLFPADDERQAFYLSLEKALHRDSSG